MGTDKVETVSYLAIFSGVTYSNFILQLSDWSCCRISLCSCQSLAPLKYSAFMFACPMQAHSHGFGQFWSANPSGTQQKLQERWKDVYCITQTLHRIQQSPNQRIWAFQVWTKLTSSQSLHTLTLDSTHDVVVLTSERCMIWSMIRETRGDTTSVTPAQQTAGSCQDHQ